MKRHRIIHVELSVADREAAAKFFSDLFGWAFTHYADQQVAMVDTGAISGALNAAADVLAAPRRVLAYIESDDAAADLERAEALGGEVLAPRTAIPGVGWFGLFTDPAGNTIGLMQFASAYPPAYPPAPPRGITRIDIPAANRDESAKFYHELFGWKIEHAGPTQNYVLYESGSIGGGFPQIDGRLYQGDDLILYVQSDDVDADLKRAESLGAKRLTGRQEIPGVGQYAIFEDPSGNRIALWKSLRPTAGV